jgi:hypothetical protein
MPRAVLSDQLPIDFENWPSIVIRVDLMLLI